MNNTIFFVLCCTGMAFSLSMIVALIIMRQKQKTEEVSIEAILASLRDNGERRKDAHGWTANDD